jgi:plasmid stability protein
MHNAVIDLIEGVTMPVVTVRNLPEGTHKALKVRAAQNGRSTEAEIRKILEDAVTPSKPVKMGTELAKIGQLLDGVDFDISRSPAPTEAAIFE